jgi:UDP-N-acetylglucosamine 1-carboxyvinyltransferase
VESLVEIIKDLGAEVEYSPLEHRLTVAARELRSSSPNPELATKFRASILLLGALLGRLGQAEVPYPGGDKIGSRPIDAHLEAFKALGVTVALGDTIRLQAHRLQGNKIVLEETSVTATENAMLAACLAEGTTVIKLAAMEPHVQQLGHFLNALGGKVSGIGTPTITIEGVQKLHGATMAVIPDSEEAASMLTLAAATKSHVVVDQLEPDFLEDYLLKLRKMRVTMEVGEHAVTIVAPGHEYVATKIQCGLYPKLNSDYLPPMAVLATQATGVTLLYEWLYENRLGYIPELHKMGAQAEILDPHRVQITGPTPLHGAKMTTYDLRMGMTLIIAALAATGESEISDIHHIDRGYEHIEGRLRALGADIKRVES